MKTRFAALALAAMLPAAAPAQDYPARPVRLVVPYAAGGNADIFGRTLAQKLGDALKQPFVVENRAGANGGIGADFVAKSAPDGHTLLVTANGPIVVNPVLYAKIPYDPVKDFAPVAQCTVYQYVLVTLAGSPIKSIADLLGGQLTFMFDTVITSVPQIRAGKLRAFAVSSLKRASSLPGVPTMHEVGIRNFDISQWQGVLAPAGTPKAIVDRLNADIVRAMRAADVRERIVTQGGNEIVTGTPEDFAALIKSDLQMYAKLIKDAKIPAQ